METIQFADRKASVDFYEGRYAQGYMGHWSSFDKDRLFGLIKSLNLPATGNALDFGCGRGIFTQVIREALPGWSISGCDISSEAIESARRNSTGINFFVLGSGGQPEKKFDFIHSHHVLEHTFDEKVTAEEMSLYAAPHCVMLHSLPCNHEGSLEYKLSIWTKNGIDPVTGKFFFEDAAHMRRMSARQAEELFAKNNFRPRKQYYSNQHWGAIKWISESSFGMVLKSANPFHSKSPFSFFKLLRWRKILVFTWFCFFAASAFVPADRGKYYTLKKFLQAVSFILFFWLAIPVVAFINSKAKNEWKEKKESPNGTDMFLVFER
jgi:2-polyprenyl-3-methyl-5-hydroxy-6-metoxy-1,4-benzoquinol methylase